VAVLAEYGEEAKILAGGQSLVPLMALRVAAPEVIIDINRVRSLDSLGSERGRIRIGALTRHRAVEQLAGLADDCPMIADAVGLIGHVAIRNRGTVVGSLAHSDPAAEWPALALALDAEITAVGPAGTRRIAAESFFETYLTNTLADDEFATHVDLVLPQGRVGSSFVELARRHGDFAIAGVGALIRLSDAGTVEEARIAVIGGGSTALRAPKAEGLMVGHAPSADLFDEVAQAVHDSVNPQGDIQGSAEYRRAITRVVARRAVAKASKRANGEGGKSNG
jgi:CO/xanthine dehydrogenase FAD-binding subunit